MKKQAITKIFASLAATLAITLLPAKAQNLLSASRVKPDQINTLTSIFDKTESSSATTTVYVKSRVMRSFLQSFSDVTEAKWNESNGHYFASFKQNNNLCKALFNNRGILIFSIRYGTEKDLPHDVRRQLKSNYVDYMIGAVTEVNTGKLHAWVVNLTDSHNLIIASAYDGTVTEMHHYKMHF
jgi:hypothetical protein